MNIRHTRRRLLAVMALISLLTTMTFQSSAALEKNKDKPSTVIRVAPPAPVFDENARLAELAARRARVAEKIGPNGILVLFSTEPRVYTNDVDYHYRQENNLFYLTNLNQKGATLVLAPGNPRLREILFLPKRDPAAETWTGHMYSPAEAQSLSGIREIWEDKEFEPFMRALRNRQPYSPKAGALFMSAEATATTAQAVTPPVPQAAQTTDAAAAASTRNVATATPANVTTTNPSSAPQQPIAQPVSATSASSATTVPTPSGFETLFAAMARDEAALYLLLPPPREENSREFRQEQTYATQWAKSASGFNVRNIAPVFAQMRLRKSPMELKLLQHAIDITTEAIGRSMATVGRSQWEYEIDAEVLYTFKRRNADHWGYPSIVGCGPNATTLHYIESQGRLKPGDLLLMDVGAEYSHYTADVTRTFPVSGKFTPAQAEIYQIVYDAQEATAAATRPGAIFPTDVHNAAVEKVKEGLLRLGLITDKNSDQYRIWFMHGTSHWLGMNVHDVGGRGVKLEPGMVFTNEPGIYIREDALDVLPKTPENERFIAAVRPAFEKYKNIGVRIEDDMLVTQSGAEWMTKALPRSIADIEAFMARAPKEVRVSAFKMHWQESGALWPVVMGIHSQRTINKHRHAS